MELATILPVIWYAILCIAVFAYALGDGFDLGLSTIYFLSKEEKERRLLLNSIGPVWDGNEVWFVIIFAGLFAGFPSAYGTLLSIFYMPIWTMVMLYVFRGCSLEFRSKAESRRWKFFWDILFSASGTFISFFLGTLSGNLLLGLPIAPETSYSSLSWGLFFRPYSVLCGLFVVAAFALHGISFALTKTAEGFQLRLKNRFYYVLSAYLVLYLGLLIATMLGRPHAIGVCCRLGIGTGIPAYPLLILLAVATFSCCYAEKKAMDVSKYGKAFAFSCINLLFPILAYNVLLFPNLLVSSVDGRYTITIFNAAVDPKALQHLITIVLIGLPFVIAYAVYVYRVFRGKTDFPSIY
ncbi:cytochrome d ubiquinol oxidase subunit II [Chlamydia muridarum str. Nigg]|jgi:cytochrome d oxidase, subunit II (cydB)|uniref:Cytochrome C oxidase assembly protein n=2 Tax=Chlamydia muridarum TaxID=83560 RepID=A0A069ZNW6_CHLMR|nr:cytochrome d ubiquinol oxidase subunit II [Chlamydia muridarum]AAF39150.1 cytochrome D ubiquinol oxidase, subunit II [Chlamydia muridarum str. Nigg]AHH22673.1 cytochrome C oxidase assembly protein [Chlamydia muridarum str. Nigg3 CMUT3-5]AHH23597.1 cytochrome C oxidase assembly protein [Chlamydia muridarum str. Nigg CM972]AID37818.1 cytochrome C oxidase assembly protein [Chlamydia muridarum str. Nigg 2 MCR]AIT90488.1 cytochrome C oxidase assembly protein [Chlamydia muridarum]